MKSTTFAVRIDTGVKKWLEPLQEFVRSMRPSTPVGRGSSMAFALGIAFDRVFAVRVCWRRCAAESNDDRDDVDVDLEQIEVARHLAQPRPMGHRG
jgi:hypothetical protein